MDSKEVYRDLVKKYNSKFDLFDKAQEELLKAECEFLSYFYKVDFSVGERVKLFEIDGSCPLYFIEIADVKN